MLSQNRYQNQRVVIFDMDHNCIEMRCYICEKMCLVSDEKGLIICFDNLW